NVTGTAAGNPVNTTSTVASANAVTGSAATASIVVLVPPTIAKSFAPTTIVNGASSTLSFTLTNPAVNTVALTNVGFTDILPFGVAVSNGSAPVCGGIVTT